MANRYSGMHGNRQIVSLLLIRQRFACFYCGRRIKIDAKHPEYLATLDHKTALVFGGEPYRRKCRGGMPDVQRDEGIAGRQNLPRRAR